MTTPADKLVGTAPCPLCGAPARVTVSKKFLTVLTCSAPIEGGCFLQLFTRSNRSDRLLRDRVTATPTPANAPEPAPAAPAAAAPKSRSWFGFGDD